MNRAQRRRLERDGRRWLASVAADPRTTHEELLVARWIAENSDENGVVEIDIDQISKAVRTWPK